MKKILVYPKDGNPYQSLLYNALIKRGIKHQYVYFFPFIGPLPFLIYAALARLLGYQILHLHWPAFNLPKPLPFHKILSTYMFKFSVAWLSLLRYKIVWTVHNVIPHEAQTSDDVLMAKYLAKRAVIKIVHSKFTIKQMQELSIDTTNAVVIPHGNYEGVYPSPPKMRRKNNDLNILFFGNIRPYKGIPELLNAYSKLSGNYKLTLAGQCKDKDLESLINSYVIKDSTISFANKHVEDKDVARYFYDADMVCLPFRSITTSGSILLSLTFGKPIVAPLSGAINDLPVNVGYLYDNVDKNGLHKALVQALVDETDRLKRGKAAGEYAKKFNWEDIANKTDNVYKYVLDSDKSAKD